MPSMPPAHLHGNGSTASARARRASRWLSLATTLLTALTVLASGNRARAETGAPLPQGYTSDIPTASAAPSQGLAVTKVSDVDDDADYYEDTDPSALTDFREPLSPYGVWVDDPTYGTVWVPSSALVGADFAPYQTAGHWAMTDDGDWLWVSDYDWGYIPFHYGRWVWIAGRGWAWIPGRRYAPAWVVWRTGSAGYIGWAPMPPTWYWSSGAAVGLWVTPYAAYCFVPSTYVFHHHVHTYVVRDPVVVRRVAASTRSYHAARPSTGSAHAASARRPYRPASPSLADAGISQNAAPKRISGDARAITLSRRSSTAAYRRSLTTARATPAMRTQAPAARSATVRPQRVDRFSVSREAREGRPVLRTPTPAPSPRFSAPSRPTFQSTPRFSAPSQPTFRSTPRYSAPSQPTFRSTPRYSAPSRPSFSAPRSAPSRPSFSAPRSAPSRPSFSRPSGGSSPRSFSGGGRRR